MAEGVEGDAAPDEGSPPQRRVGDEWLYERYERCGVPREEADRIFTESGGKIAKVLVRLAELEAGCSPSENRIPPKQAIADDEPVGVGNRGWRTERTQSVVLSVRLDPAELELLRRRAYDERMGVSVLARALIRRGIPRVP